MRDWHGAVQHFVDLAANRFEAAGVTSVAWKLRSGVSRTPTISSQRWCWRQTLVMMPIRSLPSPDSWRVRCGAHPHSRWTVSTAEQKGTTVAA